MLKPQANPLRQIHSLDGLWKFRRDPTNVGETEGWSRGFIAECELATPGSWNEQRIDLEQYFGVAWFAFSFAVPTTPTRRGAFLHFGSVQNRAKVWLNGDYLGEHIGGSLPFTFDVINALNSDGENLLVVRVDASINPWDLPPARIEANATNEGFHNSNPAVTYDFFPFGGIARPVSLQLTAHPEYIETIRIDSDLDLEAKIAKIVVKVATNQPVAGRLEVSIEGAVQSAELDAKGHAAVTLVISNPRRWDVGQPELYDVAISLLSGSTKIDAYTRSIGLRKVETTADSLLLNGKKVFLRGFGKHEDFPIIGRGLSLPLVVRDFDLLNWTGANSFRTSHYPYAEEWYEYADRQGILVIGETPLVGLCERLFNSPDALAEARQLTAHMIERDHHHPSVIMWSVANEPWIESAAGEKFISTLLHDARRQDSSRPITYVAHNGAATNAPCSDCDIVAFNRYGGWYDHPGDIKTGTRLLTEELNSYRNAYNKPILLAEFGADAIPGQHAVPATMFTEEFQADIIEAQIEAAESHPWVIGTHVWAFADFKTAQCITRAVRNHKGVFTRDRAPKMAAHRIRQLWSGK